LVFAKVGAEKMEDYLKEMLIVFLHDICNLTIILRNSDVVKFNCRIFMLYIYCHVFFLSIYTESWQGQTGFSATGQHQYEIFTNNRLFAEYV
jgi:hypothetical protein